MFRLFRLIFVITVLWFVPWAPVLYSGVLIYFPYEENGKDRYVRVTGPLLSVMSSEPDWVRSGDIPKSCKSALVAAEDTRFYEHFGVDTESISAAFQRNQAKGNLRWGGSTITQQLVKNAFLSRKKSYLRKAREATGALLLDAIMSKEGQLTWYFNIVEFGPKVYGIKAAAKHYYKKEAKNLSMSECVSLVSLLQSPKRLSRFVKQGAPSNYLKRRYKKIISSMEQLGSATSREIAKARESLF